MLQIAVILHEGVLARLQMKGHAGHKPVGGNLACAAVSIVVRSIARLVANESEWTVDGMASEPGDLFLDIIERPRDTTKWLKGVTDTLLAALADISQEFPGSLSVSIEEGTHGS